MTLWAENVAEAERAKEKEGDTLCPGFTITVSLGFLIITFGCISSTENSFTGSVSPFQSCQYFCRAECP